MNANIAPPSGRKKFPVGTIIWTVVNLVLSPFTFGITGFGVISGIASVVLNYLAVTRSEEGNQASAAGLARWARILHWITLALAIVGVVIVLILIVVFVIAILAGAASGV